MRCPGCNEETLDRVGETGEHNETAYRCPKCERLYLVYVYDVTDTISKLAERRVDADDLTKQRDRLKVQVTAVEEQLYSLWRELGAARRFIRARGDPGPPRP